MYGKVLRVGGDNNKNFDYTLELELTFFLHSSIDRDDSERESCKVIPNITELSLLMVTHSARTASQICVITYPANVEGEFVVPFCSVDDLYLSSGVLLQR